MPLISADFFFFNPPFLGCLCRTCDELKLESIQKKGKKKEEKRQNVERNPPAFNKSIQELYVV